MKIKLNEALKSYDMFIKEDDGTTVGADVQVATQDLDAAIVSKDSIIADVDHIITSLETLAGQVQEMVDSLDTEPLNEEGIGTKLLHWTLTGPKAMKAQAKVNQMKMNLADLQYAHDNAGDDKKKASLKSKIDTVKPQIDSAQQTIIDKFDSKGEIVKGMRLKKKLEGERELIKRLTGMEDNPDKKASLKDQLAKVDAKDKEQAAALKELKPDEANDEDAVKKAKEEAAAKKKSEEGAAKKAAANNSEEGGSEEGGSEEGGKEKSSADAKKADDGADDATKKDREEKNSKEGKLKRLEDLMAKAKEGGDEEKIKKVQDLIDKISAKESWQIENTELGRLLEAEITKLEASFVLNESRYFNNSIKDAFSKLI